MKIKPITLKAANEFITKYHRHNAHPQGCKFAISVVDGEILHGVAVCGRPVSRELDDGVTLEIIRNCTDGTRNACSMLYGACVRVAKAMGYKRVVTYTLTSEPGASLKASNFEVSAENCGGGSWSCKSREREVSQPSLFGEIVKYQTETKTRWEINIK